MIMQSRNIFERETKLSLDGQKKLVNWFNKQQLELKMDIMKKQKNSYFKLKNTKKDINDSLMTLISFYLAIQSFYHAEKNLRQKNKTMKIEKIPNKDYKKPRKRKKREEFLKLLPIIRKWKEKKYGSRRIKNKIKSKLDISHTYICILWNELHA